MGTFQRRCKGSIRESLRISMYILIMIEKKTIPALAPTAENCYNMIPGSKGHAFHACMKKHDFGIRKI
jgi:hypothetical protein